jgi:hypothetical protein
MTKRKNMEKKQKIYKTKNLFIATYLLASGEVDFNGVEKLDYKTKLFRFSPIDKARELEAAYFTGGRLPAKTLFNEYNTLKDLLFQGEPNEKQNGYT